MSAYVVSDTTINSIVSFLENIRLKPLYNFYLEPFRTYHREWYKLTNEMLELNCQAVNGRYNKNDSPSKMRFEFVPGNLVQVFKNLQCYLYQCSEGDIPQTSELYKKLEVLKNQLAVEIVQNLPEYNNAKWGQD